MPPYLKVSDVGGHVEPLYMKQTQQLLAMTAHEHRVMEYLMLNSVKENISIQDILAEIW